MSARDTAIVWTIAALVGGLLAAAVLFFARVAEQHEKTLEAVQDNRAMLREIAQDAFKRQTEVNGCWARNAKEVVRQTGIDPTKLPCQGGLSDVAPAPR